MLAYPLFSSRAELKRVSPQCNVAHVMLREEQGTEAEFFFDPAHGTNEAVQIINAYERSGYKLVNAWVQK
jgi:hypothetical protein